MKQLAYFNWSGGKDSSLALYHVLKEEIFDVKSLLTSINGKYNRVSMHGVRENLLDLQAQKLGLPIQKVYLPEQPDMDHYNQAMKKAVLELKNQGINNSIFGDIFLEDLKVYREQQLKSVGLNAIFPIWKKDTKKLLNEFIDLGFKTILVSIDANKLNKEFAGREIDRNFIKDLPKNVDPCGENGEFHTFVYDGPIFQEPIPVIKGELIYREYNVPNDNQNDNETNKYGYWFCDLNAKESSTKLIHSR